jgi:hypothetical protein
MPTYLSLNWARLSKVAISSNVKGITVSSLLQLSLSPEFSETCLSSEYNAFYSELSPTFSLVSRFANFSLFLFSPKLTLFSY